MFSLRFHTVCGISCIIWMNSFCGQKASVSLTQNDRPFMEESQISGTWNIPPDDIISTGIPKDGIPSLFNPPVIPASEADYLSDDDLVVGIVVNGQARAYPYTILDWHEVVNEDFPQEPLTITYCPLTGSALIFKARNAGTILKFGVSGLLYNNNLIMFDRETDSHWPQMRLQCDQGALRNTRQKIYPAIETNWGAWKKLFPNTVILSTNTGYKRPYNQPGTAYPDYDRLQSLPLFPITYLDTRLPPKQKVHGILVGDSIDNFKSKVYVLDKDASPSVINDRVGDLPVVIIEDGGHHLIVSYVRKVNGKELTFHLAEDSPDFQFYLKDQETGSQWNILGKAVSGSLSGTKLNPTLSYNAYWFAWAVFYPDTQIYSD